MIMHPGPKRGLTASRRSGLERCTIGGAEARRTSVAPVVAPIEEPQPKPQG